MRMDGRHDHSREKSFGMEAMDMYSTVQSDERSVGGVGERLREMRVSSKSREKTPLKKRGRRGYKEKEREQR